MWYTKYSGLCNIWMFVQDFFNFSWIYIQSTSYNHVFFTINYKKVTFFIHSTHIACYKPTVYHCLFCLFFSILLSYHLLWTSHCYYPSLSMYFLFVLLYSNILSLPVYLELLFLPLLQQAILQVFPL